MLIKSLLSFVVFFSFACTCFGQIENRATLQYLFYNPTNDQNSNNVNQSNVELNYFLKSKKIFKKVRWDNSFGYKTLFLDQGINQNLQDISYTSNFIYTKNLKNFFTPHIYYHQSSVQFLFVQFLKASPSQKLPSTICLLAISSPPLLKQ